LDPHTKQHKGFCEICEGVPTLVATLTFTLALTLTLSLTLFLALFLTLTRRDDPLRAVVR
jgi:hypothetical protein